MGVAAVGLVLVAAITSALAASSFGGKRRYTTYNTAIAEEELGDHLRGHRRHLTFAWTRTKTWDNEKSSGELTTTKGLKGFVTSLTIDLRRPEERGEEEEEEAEGEEQQGEEEEEEETTRGSEDRTGIDVDRDVVDDRPGAGGGAGVGGALGTRD